MLTAQLLDARLARRVNIDSKSTFGPAPDETKGLKWKPAAVYGSLLKRGLTPARLHRDHVLQLMPNAAAITTAGLKRGRTLERELFPGRQLITHFYYCLNRITI